MTLGIYITSNESPRFSAGLGRKQKLSESYFYSILFKYKTNFKIKLFLVKKDSRHILSVVQSITFILRGVLELWQHH